MDEELKGQVTELFSGLMETAKTEILTAVDQKNSGAVASMKREVKSALDPITSALEGLKTQPTKEPGDSEDDSDKPASGKLTLKALQQQLSQLQTELATEKTKISQEREATFNAERSSVIANAIASKGLVNPGIASDALHRRYGDKMAKEEGVWYVKDGEIVKPFDTVFGEFVGSKEGEFFLPPSSTRGAGSTEGKTTATTSSAEMSLDEALMSAF